jgi:hypothetical protein
MPTFVPTRKQVIEVFRNSMAYEIMFTFGVPGHDSKDYCQWETVNFTRIGHARVLYSFFRGTAANRPKDDVVSEDYGFPATGITLPAGDEDRTNKDLMHLTYSRLRHTAQSKCWPDSILACLQPTVIDFMEHVKSQDDLFQGTEKDVWMGLLAALKSGRELNIRGDGIPDGRLCYQFVLGRDLPNGLPALTRFGV